MLHISGSRKETFSANGQVSRKKRRVSYSMTLDRNVDVKEMKANLSDGVLLVSAPKVAKAEPISIAISNEAEKDKVVLKDSVESKTDGEKTSK